MNTSAIEFSSDPFAVKFRSCAREPEGWKEEVSKAAFSLIAQAGNRPIIVCFSGGVDSEVLCRSLFEQGIHFSTLTVVDSKGRNKNEVDFATYWCRNRGVSQHIVQLDFEDFYRNGIERYIQDGYAIVNIFRYLQFFLLEQTQSIGGFAVLAGSEPRLSVSEDPEPEPYFLFSAGFIAPLVWMQKNNLVHQPYFYLSSPELVYSFLRAPMVDVALTHPEMLRNRANRFMLKHFVQYAYWPDIQLARKNDDDFDLRRMRSEKERELRTRFERQTPTLKLYIKDIREQFEKDIKK